MKKYNDYNSDNGAQFECDLCGKMFPASPNCMIESVNKDDFDNKMNEDSEQENYDDLYGNYQDENKDFKLNDFDIENSEVFFLCKDCMSQLEDNDEGEL